MQFCLIILEFCLIKTKKTQLNYRNAAPKNTINSSWNHLLFIIIIITLLHKQWRCWVRGDKILVRTAVKKNIGELEEEVR